ncbi:DUF4270 domain-containing protein [Tenacibaculum aquimarinum]|uniref:DUF4270 domain-containing protein n=1 Tax=Tenacibaculum aquimarinum TaxID=2910675 RepID=UPI001F0AF8C4|nr:DUF4270 domain-containing protein [Tenacibaculum aquimarinum]MCH3881260.1 DUF4270 domain-containing protein [Tenacibaculum aquimarinum]
MIKKSVYVGSFLLFLFGVISCEKDFTDIGSSVINNGVFETKDTLLDITISPVDIAAVRADGGISVNLGEYLLGVYKSDDFKTIEASIVSQIGLLADLKVVENTYGTDTTVVTKMDKVLIRLPYQSTNTVDVETSDGNSFKIDSILGDPTIPVAVKVYRNLTFLNTLDPANPTQQNTYLSDAVYSKGNILNEDANFSFTVPQNETTQDTMYVFDRNLSNGNTFKDTLKIANSAPFMAIPLDKDEIKALFLDKYETTEFESLQAFQNYFRGLIIEASGTDGSLIPFNFSTGSPVIDIFYTNTVLANGSIIDTIVRNNSFPLSGVTNSIYKPTAGNAPAAGNFVVQGTAGTMANIDILQGTELQDLRSQDWLINDASLVFYVEQSKDTTNVPLNLFLYKNEDGNPSLIKDIITEGTSVFGGQLLIDENGAKDRYHFRITDYISDLLSGESSYNPPLGLKVFNTTDLPSFTTDTIVGSFNWNPRGIVLHSNTSSNVERKAQLKISYSIKK